jgi:DNA-binding MarR family transcriptional regulator
MSTDETDPAIVLREILSQAEMSRRLLHDYIRLLENSGFEVNEQELRVLMRLHDHGPSHLSPMASALGVNRSTMTRVVEQLVSKGYLVRRPSPHDGRALHVDMTPAANHGLDTAVSVVDSFLETVDPDDVRLIQRLLGRLNQNFRS